MKGKKTLIGLGWFASTAAAFWIGKSSSPSSSLVTEANTTERTNQRITQQSQRSSAFSQEPLITGERTFTPSNRKEFTAEIGRLTKLSDPIERTSAFLKMVDTLSPGEFEDAVASFRRLNMTRDRLSEYAILLTAWSKNDPISALTYATENTDTPFARQTILASWARESPDAAIAWARENFEGEGNQPNPWLVGVIKGLANTNLNQATTLLNELPISHGRGQALDSIMVALGEESPDTAKNWVLQLNDERLQARAASQLVANLAEENPREALTWAESLGEEALKRSAPRVIESWIKEDKSSALSWLDQQNDEIRSTTAPELIQHLEVDEAQDWLANYEGNPSYDRAIQTFARSVMEDTPELGADWIMRMANEGQRSRTFHRILLPWLRSDRDGLVEYARNNPIPKSVLQRLNSALSEG